MMPEGAGRGRRVVVAMSGGVDSSVTAALLLERGYEVIGITMQIWEAGDPLEEAREGGCCSLSAVSDARRVAEILGIPYYVANMREVFAREVIGYFVEEYSRGRTPNPCIICNQKVKFEALLRKAAELEADYLATGHYARLWHDERRQRFLLGRARDRDKDQSYVLYGLTQEQMSRLLFPLGDYTKAEVREMAARLGLPVAAKPDSQEICFVEAGRHGEFVAERARGRVRPGPILDTSGRVVGQHRGLAHYTVGQRRGLGIAAPRPLYVLCLDPERNALIVGTAEEAYAAGMTVGRLNLIAFDSLPAELRAGVQVRYRARPEPATISPLQAGEGATGEPAALVRFDEPQRGVTPGQAAVFYEGDLVLGGGIIERVLREL